MILYLLAGAGAFLYVMKHNGGNTTSSARAKSDAHSVGSSGGGVNINVGTGSGSGQGAGSGSGGSHPNANQPWYTGALIAGGGIAATQVAKGLGSLLQRSAGAPDMTVVDQDESDFQEVSLGPDSDAGDSSYSSSSNDETYASSDDVAEE